MVTRDVFLLGIDHGIRPKNASYQYIVVPGVTTEQLSETSANNRNIEILSNTPALQAVKHNGLGICQIAFYQAGDVEIANGASVSMDSHAMAMLKMKGEKIVELSVSDPSRKLDTIAVTVPGIYNSQGENFTTHPQDSENRTLITIDLPTDVYAGSSVTINL